MTLALFTIAADRKKQRNNLRGARINADFEIHKHAGISKSRDLFTRITSAFPARQINN
jgi:hypothetical protein